MHSTVLICLPAISLDIREQATLKMERMERFKRRRRRKEKVGQREQS
jgi:hypothetical protein